VNPELSIIVPAYNEEARLGTSVEQIFQFVRSRGLDAEVVIVDDGSSDRTAETAEAAASRAGAGGGARVIRYEPNRGKGFAVRTGLDAARAPIALFTDADLSTPIDEMDKLLKPIRDGLMDVTFGSRALDRSLIGTHQPWRREQGGKVFNLVVRLSTGLPFWDTQCGFKAFRMSAFRPMLSLMRIDRFGFDVEFLYVAHLHGLRLNEVPVRWNNDERSKVSIFRDSIRMFNEVLEIRRNARRGLYNTP
jgi:dolichyl-phosphate beta-glucosyltransferase